MEQNPVFTLKQVATSIQKHLAERYQRTYWVLAEVHKLNLTRKGHCYPELVHKEDGVIVAQLRGTIWNSAFQSIQTKFNHVVNEPLRDGMQLLLLVKITYHPLYNVGLDILDIDPNYTVGALQQERQETLNRLQKEGILGQNQALKMALLPKRIAVISQQDSKGYSDFMTLLNGHPNGYRFDTFLFEATLQGDAAIQSIQNQLIRIKQVKHLFDAVVLIRGGGDEAGMHCYNTYDLAKAIVTFPLPVLAGIGHSTNLTVSEMVAYFNGITPSDLAYYFLKIMEELDEPLDGFLQQIPQVVQRTISNKRVLIQHAQEFLSATSRSELNHAQQKLELTGNQFISSVNERQAIVKHELIALQNFAVHASIRTLQLSSQTLAATQQRIGTSALTLIPQHLMQINQQVMQLNNHSMNRINCAKQLLENNALHVHLANPQHILEKGYALVKNKHGYLTKQNTVVSGEKISIQLASQSFDAQVE